MTIDYIILFIAAICFSILGGAWVGFHLATFKSSVDGSSSGPSIVVNVPANWKPIDALPPTQIEGARAQLWYTVYQAAIDDNEFAHAADDANAAVDKVFGS